MSGLHASHRMRTRSAADDPFISELRNEISANDRRIVAAVNTRLDLVARMRSYKDSRGMPLYDAEREESLLRFLEQTNAGPLSVEGVEEILRTLLEITRRELGSRGSDGS